MICLIAVLLLKEQDQVKVWLGANQNVENQNEENQSEENQHVVTDSLVIIYIVKQLKEKHSTSQFNFIFSQFFFRK